MGKGIESLYPFPLYLFAFAPSFLALPLSPLPFFPVTLSSLISWEPFHACGV